MNYIKNLLPLLFFLRFLRKPLTSFPILNSSRSILLIAGCRLHDFESVIEQVYKGFHGSLITVLAKQAIIDSYGSDSRINNFILYPYQGFLKVSKVGKEYFERIKDTDYDLVLVVYNNYAGKNCFNLERFGKKCGGKNLMGFFRSGHLFPLNGNYWKINFIQRVVELGWYKFRDIFNNIIDWGFSILNLMWRFRLKGL